MAPRINFRHLEMFRLLMKTKNLTETAKLMRVSQPAISQSLRELEGQLGLTLFVRAAGRVRPTSEALDLLPDVERVFGQLSMLTGKAEQLKDVQGGRLEVAAIPALAMSGLPQAIQRFRRERPFSHVMLQSVGTAEVISAVKEESVNLGFVATPIEDPSVGIEPLLDTEFCCFLPANHRLASREQLGVDDFEGETLIALSTESPPGLYFRGELARRKKDQLVAVETNSAYAALAMVEAGVGIGVLDPLPSLGGVRANVTIRPFRPSVAITVAVVFSRHRPLSRIELEFIDGIRTVLHQDAERLRGAAIFAEGR